MSLSLWLRGGTTERRHCYCNNQLLGWSDENVLRRDLGFQLRPKIIVSNTEPVMSNAWGASLVLLGCNLTEFLSFDPQLAGFRICAESKVVQSSGLRFLDSYQLLGRQEQRHC